MKISRRPKPWKYPRLQSVINILLSLLSYSNTYIVYFLVLILKKLMFGSFIKHLLISPNFNILLNHGKFELYSLAAVVEIVIYDTTAVVYCLDITPPYALTYGIKLTWLLSTIKIEISLFCWTVYSTCIHVRQALFLGVSECVHCIFT